MQWRIPATVSVLLMIAGSAQAQNFNFTGNGSFGSQLAGAPVIPNNTFLYGTGPDPSNGGAQVFSFIRLSDLQQSIQGPTAQGLVTIANRLDRLADRFREGIALAGAINVLPPNPGDRFAVSFGGAGYDGSGAGSVAVSARINESTIAYVGYARGATQNLVKGGVGFSFR